MQIIYYYNNIYFYLIIINILLKTYIFKLYNHLLKYI